MTITKVGRHTYGVNNITLMKWNENKNVEIGSFCSIAARITIYLAGNHRKDHVTTYPFGNINKPNIFNNFDPANFHTDFTTNGPVFIGNDVWIGNDATIMSGITIGDGAVIAANSHVVKNVEPYTIVGGNPAKPIRKRFPDHQIESLLKIQWWNWSDEKINRYIPLLCNTDIQQFINYALEDQLEI